MKKIYTPLFALVVIGIFSVACHRTTKVESTEGVQPKEIMVLLGAHPYGDLLMSLLPEFENATGIKVIVEQLNENDLNQRLTAEFSANASTVDVFMTRPLQETLLFLKNDWIAALDEYDFSDYPSNTVDVGRKDGKPYVVPLIVEWQVLYYRKDLLDAAGLKVPATFEELENAARILNKDGVAGFASRGAASPFSIYLPPKL